MVNLALGYLGYIIMVLGDKIIDGYGKSMGLFNSDIKWVKIALRGGVLCFLGILAVKSLVKMTVSDAIAGMFRFVDEFILGYLFASSLISFGSSITGIVNDVLSGLEGG